MTELQPGEFVKRWQDLDRFDHKIIIDAWKKKADNVHFKIDTETLIRIFNVGNPNMIFGKKDGQVYIRLDPESKKLMTILINAYG